MRIRADMTAIVAVLAACGRGPAGGSGDVRDPGASGVPAEVGLWDAGPEERTEEPDPGGRADAPDPTGPPEPPSVLDLPGAPDLSDSGDDHDSSGAPDPDSAFDRSEGSDQADPAGADTLGDPSDRPDGSEILDSNDLPDLSDTAASPDLADGSDPAVPSDLGPPPEPSLCWSDSFEWDANPGWEATGLWHRVHAGQDLADVWAGPPYDYVVLNGPATLTKPKDGTHAFWYGRDEDGSYLGTPDDNQVAGGGTSVEPHEGVLASPWLDLTGAAHATLIFWSWWEIESQHPAGYDLSTVEVTADGETWTEVARLNPPGVPPGANPVLPYTVNGVGMPPSWQRTLAPLDAFAGGPVRVRFRFRTGDVFFNAFRGWVVDEVSVECAGQIGSIPASPKSAR